MFRICKEYRFEAAHRLPNHDGQCARPHGHSYVVEVELKGSSLPQSGPKEGMLLDFHDLDKLVKPLIDALDHQDLNEVVPYLLDVEPTTAENLAYGMWRRLDGDLRELTRVVRVSSVRVRETAKAWAEYWPEYRQ